MAVTVNATATAAVQVASGSITVTSTNLTIASGATALLAIVQWSAAATAPTVRAVNWDSTGTPQLMTELTFIANTSTNDTSVGLYGLLAPTIGNKTIAATWTGSSIGTIMALSFASTDTGSIANCFQHATTNTGSSATATVTGTSAVNNINVCGVSDYPNSITGLTATGSTLLSTMNTHAGSGSARATGAATVAWTGTLTSSPWAIACVDVCVPVAAAAKNAYQPWYQLAPILAQ